MSDAKRPCPACGEPVYATDDVCMSCGAQLKQVTGPSPPTAPPSPVSGPPQYRAPGAPPPPPPMAEPAASDRRGRRKQANPTFYHGIVEGMGGFWDWYPWLGLVVGIGWRVLGMAGAPAPVVLAILLLQVIWASTYILWVIFDVLYFGAHWWWIILSICCYPIGLVLYLVKGREA